MDTIICMKDRGENEKMRRKKVLGIGSYTSDGINQYIFIPSTRIGVNFVLFIL